MRLVLFAALLTISTAAFANPFAPFDANTLPMITAEQFQVGNYWVWSYYEQGDRSNFYSSEKYIVTDVAGDRVTFEIWTLYAGKSTYTPSARFKVSLTKCLHEYWASRRQPFTIEMYSYANGQWSTEPYNMRATAFEEKFNCNPIEYPANHPVFNTVYETATTAWGTAQLFQQRPSIEGNQVRSFYFLDHADLTGIAYKKVFNPNSPHEFEMELTEKWPERPPTSPDSFLPPQCDFGAGVAL